MRVTSTTRRKLYALANSKERRYLDWLKWHIMEPLGDWQCQQNPYAPVRGTVKLTAALVPLITGQVYSVGGPTIPIPIEEQVTGRIPLEV